MCVIVLENYNAIKTTQKEENTKEIRTVCEESIDC